MPHLPGNYQHREWMPEVMEFGLKQSSAGLIVG
jgi:hypothetical protein